MAMKAQSQLFDEQWQRHFQHVNMNIALAACGSTTASEPQELNQVAQKPAVTTPEVPDRPPLKPIRAVIEFNSSQLQGCCGMCVLHDIVVYEIEEYYATPTARFISSRRITVPEDRLRKIFAEQVRNFQSMRNAGQVIITEVIGTCNSQLTPLKVDRGGYQTKKFIEYLMEEKIGTLMRGPISINPRYFHHAICAWIWIPRGNRCLHERAPLLYESTISEQNRKIAEACGVPEFLEEELRIVNGHVPKTTPSTE
jgi:hypothetical protein